MDVSACHYIVVEGPIGAGKTSLARALAAHLHAETLLELPEDNPFLARFYEDMARYAAAIQSQRGDYNGKVLSIRSEDLRSLAIIYDMSAGELTDQLIDWGVLPPDARPARDA